MVQRRIYLIVFTLALLIGVLHSERVRYDELQDDDDDERDGRKIFKLQT